MIKAFITVLGLFIAGSTVVAKPYYWSGSTAASYSSDFEGANPSALFSLALNYPVSDVWTLGLSQAVSKKFYIFPNEDEFGLTDTVVSTSHKLIPIWGLEHTGSFSLSLPISESSLDNEKITTAKAAWSGSHSILDSQLSLSYGLNAAGYFSVYQSELSDDGLGGAPLPTSSVGISHGGSYTMLESLSANYSISYTRVWYYNLDPEVTSLLIAIADVPNELFNNTIGLTYSMDKGLSVSAGFSKGNQITQLGSIDLAIFDAELTQYYLSLAWSFSKETFFDVKPKKRKRLRRKAPKPTAPAPTVPSKPEDPPQLQAPSPLPTESE
ncbi:hypothetical protein [Pseudobacteriovorax antillogorgiicola]|uniref:MetA-pathway of phenol degradation n=1 Tax=Pseudobacteriovorax antillogorgiicola TaxID=1513793 RepID=A0A1Y6BCW3_9BACT|nr:hypothetical protein [Pseudobacteriovorax antillogorgiicola]TCS58587.1 hypothetical protein EDD56_102100 [Pseudobacteriovorax antillogorgiicola]SME97193.1 hypothetical protein SAMN06296036_102343 [Pseudobacteriovorax antillogorgiicola]